jgi:DNA-directed RNA polymerase subunit RPC12/RpoP
MMEKNMIEGGYQVRYVCVNCGKLFWKWFRRGIVAPNSCECPLCDVDNSVKMI